MATQPDWPDPNIPAVETSTVLFGEIVDAVDKTRQKEIANPVTYRFGGDRVIKRLGRSNPYE